MRIAPNLTNQSLAQIYKKILFLFTFNDIRRIFGWVINPELVRWLFCSTFFFFVVTPILTWHLQTSDRVKMLFSLSDTIWLSLFSQLSWNQKVSERDYMWLFFRGKPHWTTASQPEEWQRCRRIGWEKNLSNKQ